MYIYIQLKTFKTACTDSDAVGVVVKLTMEANLQQHLAVPQLAPLLHILLDEKKAHCDLYCKRCVDLE